MKRKKTITAGSGVSKVTVTIDLDTKYASFAADDLIKQIADDIARSVSTRIHITLCDLRIK